MCKLNKETQKTPTLKKNKIICKTELCSRQKSGPCNRLSRRRWVTWLAYLLLCIVAEPGPKFFVILHHSCLSREDGLISEHITISLHLISMSENLLSSGTANFEQNQYQRPKTCHSIAIQEKILGRISKERERLTQFGPCIIAGFRTGGLSSFRRHRKIA